MKDETMPDTLEFLTDELPELTPFEGDFTDLAQIKELFSMRANYSVHKTGLKLMEDP
eukprot:CAMPEP_0168354790 /NCGR_PEP_ID=MMETSP0213-20121227/24122_1 /TAXON_ID=151035 /ORGANISM="Euplotes harpa, Strain FSP1.4" /LENGTH=56 /DNA_ID=CAMNT_0008366791 /DNA_START=30 /DNA_END=197 /DNA_ORIENTATION=-